MNYISLAKNRWVQLAAACLAFGIGGFLFGQESKNVQTETVEVVKEVKTVDHEAVRVAVEQARAEWKREAELDETITVVEKPTGEKIRTEKRSTKVKEEKKTEQVRVVKEVVKEQVVEVKEKLVEKKVTAAMSRFSLGVSAVKDLDEAKPVDYRAEAGVRTLGELWVKSSYQFKEKSVSLGLEFRF
jgi:hypothetical protein